VSDAFVPLGVFLRSSCAEEAIDEPPEPPTAQLPAVIPEREETLRAVRRFGAALADALDAAVQQLLRLIASDVLARELHWAGADLDALIGKALERFRTENVLSIRVNPGQAQALAGKGLTLIADGAIAPGDLRIDLQSGTIDLSLSARLDEALAAWTG